uniref:C-type lectin domain-containing protein n=1 Tax=Caenorhabditis tropicalis TaxID=1561998 RepID=A0A1I7T090_9PELO
MTRQLLILAVFFVAVQSMGVPTGDCNEVPQCPHGFDKFSTRSNGPWCMKVIPGNMTWWEAERECRCTTRGGHLSGIETSTEKRWVEQRGQELLDAKKILNGAIWIGAYRRKECPSGSQSSNSVCHDESLFQFTDQHTCKTFIFQNWASSQPTNNAGDDCAAILVSTESSGANMEASGKTTAKNCLQTTGSTPMLPVGYVCGVKPTQPDHSYGNGNSGYGSGYGGGNGGQVFIIGAGKPGGK